MKFSFKILWKSLKNFVEIAQKFREIFLKVTRNSPEICINSLKRWMKYFWKLSEIYLKIGEIFLKILWNFVKNTLDCLSNRVKFY